MNVSGHLSHLILSFPYFPRFSKQFATMLRVKVCRSSGNACASRAKSPARNSALEARIMGSKVSETLEPGRPVPPFEWAEVMATSVRWVRKTSMTSCVGNRSPSRITTVLGCSQNVFPQFFEITSPATHQGESELPSPKSRTCGRPKRFEPCSLHRSG